MVKYPKKRSSSSGVDRHFFKVYLPSDSSKRLKIPTTFIEGLSRALPEKIILKDSLERLCCVEVKKVEDNFFFHNGWQGFVKSHSLILGEFLVFKYDGNSTFEVLLYEHSGCEKEERSYENMYKSSYFVKEGEEKNDAEEAGEQEQDQLMTETDTEEEDEDEDDDDEEEEEEEEETESGTEEEEGGGASKAVQKNYSRVGKKIGKSGYQFTQPKRKAFDYAEIEEASGSSKPKPYFTVSYSPKTPYYLACELQNIPKQLVVDNNIQLSSELILRDQTRRSWPVTTRFTSDGRYWITKGWHDFCVGNNIQENDYFTFEFLQGKGFSRTVIDVHITRPTCKGFNGA